MEMLTGNSIMVVDDDPYILEYYRDVLKEEVGAYYEASNGKEAYEILKKSKIDLAVVDLRMPVLDGISLCKTIKEQKLAKSTIVATGYGQEKELKSLIRIGINDFMDKPFDTSVLKKNVKRELAKINNDKAQLMASEIIWSCGGKDGVGFGEMDKESQVKLLENLVEQYTKLFNNQLRIATVIHNLRNPLQVIRGYLDVLALKHGEETEVIKAQKAVNTLDEIISSHMEIVGAKFKAEPVVPTNINKVLTETIDDFTSPELESLGYELIFLPMELPDLAISRIKIEQCFNNIIDNAIQAMAISAKKQLIIQSWSKDNAIYIKFSDTGPGISPKHLKNIFKPLFTTKKSQGETGTGLGLAFVKEVMDTIGGDIKVQSAENKGSTFTLEIPIQNKQQTE